MAVEVDQSGKIEQLNTTTVIACANDVSSAVFINAAEKRKLFLQLRTSLVPKRDCLAVIFGVLVFLLRTLEKIPSMIVLDEEYTGKDALVCETLEKLLIRQSKGKWQGIIRVQQVGKHSPAHYLSWDYHRTARKRRNSIQVIAADILRLWQ